MEREKWQCDKYRRMKTNEKKIKKERKIVTRNKMEEVKEKERKNSKVNKKKNERSMKKRKNER